MKEWFSAVWIVGNLFLHSDLLEELLAYTLHIEEIAVSVHSKCKHGTLIRKLCNRKGLRKIDISKLVKTNIFITSVIVCGKGCQHTVQCACTHDTVVLSKRIADGDDFTKITVLRNTKLVKYLRAFERIGHSL